MAILRRIAAGALCALAAATSLLTAAPAWATPDPAPTAPCYNGIAPFNPYIDNCAIPNRPPTFWGGAGSDRHFSIAISGQRRVAGGCLSHRYVNGGPYAGIAVG